jgi:hypothetical protein
MEKFFTTLVFVALNLFHRYRDLVTIRYRCTACGNLTRFDVVETTTVRSFHHFTVGGDLTVESPETIRHTVESVDCRWCGHGRSVEIIDEETASA